MEASAARGGPSDSPIAESANRPYPRGPIVLAVYGDPVVGRALVGLLGGSRYDARFLPNPPFDDSVALTGVDLLLVTPMPWLNEERRRVLLTSLEDKADAEGVPILELTTSAQESRDGQAQAGTAISVAWPCSVEELKSRIEDAAITGP